MLIQGVLAEALEFPATGGLLIEGIENGSPAATAGLRGPTRTVIAGGMYRIGVGGDLIVPIDGKPRQSPAAPPPAMNAKPAGEQTDFTLCLGAPSMKGHVELRHG